MRPIKGWLERQEAAKAVLAARANGDVAHKVYDDPVNAERRKMIEDKEAADRAHAAEVERQRTVMMVECPCCSGKGIALLYDAAKAIEALRRYDFAGWRPDADTMGRLLPKAVAVNSAGERVTATETIEAQSDDEALAELVNDNPKKGRAKHVPPPFLSE